MTCTVRLLRCHLTWDSFRAHHRQVCQELCCRLSICDKNGKQQAVHSPRSSGIRQQRIHSNWDDIGIMPYDMWSGFILARWFIALCPFVPSSLSLDSRMKCGRDFSTALLPRSFDSFHRLCWRTENLQSPSSQVCSLFSSFNTAVAPATCPCTTSPSQAGTILLLPFCLIAHTRHLITPFP